MLEREVLCVGFCRCGFSCFPASLPVNYWLPCCVAVGHGAVILSAPASLTHVQLISLTVPDSPAPELGLIARYSEGTTVCSLTGFQPLAYRLPSI